MKNIYVRSYPPKNNIAKEFQVYLYIQPLPIVDIELSLGNEYSNKKFTTHINLFDILSFNMYTSKECDHAGFNLDINLFGFNMCYSKYDVRHWDDENGNWVK
jgi:hypothetical protein